MRKITRFFVVLFTALILIFGIIRLVYRQTYSVSFKGEIIGYTTDKLTLQKRINDYISSGDGKDIAFVDMKDMPTYEVCLLKKNVSTNDDDIFNKVISSGTSYYKYYVITSADQSKLSYVNSFKEAQEVIGDLKDKDSANVDTLGIVEKYDVAKVDCGTVDDAVNNFYEKKEETKSNTTVKTTNTKSSNSSAYEDVGTKIYSDVGTPTDLGVSLIKPVTGIISSRFGIRRIDNHKGLDIAAPKGTAIKAATGGTVIFAGYGSGANYGGYGNAVVIQSGKVKIIYGHCSKLYVQKGAQVAQGQLIGAVGSTGFSTGNHLHFEIRVNGVAVNPQKYIYK